MPEAIKISTYEIKENNLIVTFDQGEFEKVSDGTLKLLLADRDSDYKTDLSVDPETINNKTGFALNLDMVPFHVDGKTIFDLFIYNKEEIPTKLYKPSPDLKSRSTKYHQTAYQFSENNIAILYLTTKNELSILAGNKAQVYKSFCTFIKDSSFIDGLQVIDNQLSLTFDKLDFTKLEDFYFVIKDRNSSDDSQITNYTIVNQNTVFLNLLDREWSLKSRYDLFLNIKIGRVIKTLRVLVNEDAFNKRNFSLINVDETLNVLPYITTNNEIAFVGVDHSLYELELNKDIKEIFFNRTSVNNQLIRIFFDQEQINKIHQAQKWHLEIKNEKNTHSFLLSPQSYHLTTNSLEIDLEKIIPFHTFNKNNRWEFYLKLYNQEIACLEIYQLTKQSVKANEIYYKALELENETNVIIYISSTNHLGFLLGDKFEFSKLTCPHVELNICIEDLRFFDNRIEFMLSDFPTNNIEAARITLKKRKSKDTWSADAMISEKGILSFELDDFIESNQYTKSRWDFYLEIVHDQLFETGKIGCFYDEVLPKHLRYFSPIAESGNNVFTPYLTIYNELSLIINDKLNVTSEMVSPKISLTAFNMKKAKMVCTVKVELPEVEHFEINSIMMKYRGKADEVIEYQLPLKRSEDHKTYKVISFEIDVTKYEFQPFYWDLFVLINIDGDIFPVKVKNPSKEVKRSINKKITQFSYTFENGYFIYPYISAVNTLALTYREKPSYESAAYKVKENLAYITYRLFKKYFDKKDIWLAYEKFSEGAQDNGYYFFKYCYENNKKKDFYYIIKNDSPDYENIANMQDKVIPFMSFKYMLMMYAAKLLISSESKGHAYDIRIQKGRLKYALSKKKHVFLQHGVTALKRVDYVFKKTKNNAVDLFVATSDYEKDIIKKYFNYTDDEIITTGFCRWDVLDDTSGENKEIFVMPTWRTWMDDLPEEQFLESDYYKNYVGFFKSERLKELLAKNNVKLSFYIHPKFKTYIDSFNVDNENIKIYQYGEEKVNKLLMQTSMLITDYSSVAWEMYYQKKPVIFFQFDADKYNAFQGSYLDMDTELPGDRVFDVDQLLDSVEEYISRDFKEKDEFSSIRGKYFKYVDKNNCERTYEAIKSYWTTLKKTKN